MAWRTRTFYLPLLQLLRSKHLRSHEAKNLRHFTTGDARQAQYPEKQQQEGKAPREMKHHFVQELVHLGICCLYARR